MLKFWKVESVGNDFPLVHLDDVPAASLPRLARLLSDRRFGVGGDGLLAVGMEEGDLRLRMFNPDGSEDFCGNGLRCAADHARRMGWTGDALHIRHLGERVPATLRGPRVETVLEPASYDPARIPARFPEAGADTFDRVVWEGDGLALRGSSLTTGSTHTVLPGPLPTDAELARLGPRIENAPQFPERTSVIWYREETPMTLRIRIWERAAGETLGCGTGSAAAAVDYLRRTGLGGPVEVINPGGVLEVCADRWDAPISVAGEARETYSGRLDPSLWPASLLNPHVSA